MKSRKLVFVLILCLLFVLCAGVTYAYFEFVIFGNDNSRNVSVSTGSLLLEYFDGQEIVGTSIHPGWTASKTFTVENKSSMDVYYTIDWKNLVNDIENNEMKLSATCTSSFDGENDKICAGIDETTVASYPNNIKGQTFIASGYKHTYVLTIRFEEKNSEQNYNQGKSFFGVININEESDEKYSWNVELLAMTLDGEEITSLPSTGQFVLRSYACENGDNLKYDSATRKLSLESSSVNPVGCYLNFASSSSLNTTISKKVYDDNAKVPSRTDFSTGVTSNTTGNIYYTSTNTESVCNSSDTLTYVSGSGNSSICKTYYFAGNTQNNHLSFGGYMWRIIRINEDESLRIIYQGDINKQVSGTTGYISVGVPYASNAITDNREIGYFFGNSCSSYETCHTNTSEHVISTSIKAWYVANLIVNYNSYFSQTAIYCNDRSIYSGNGYGTNETYYGAYNRLVTNKNPQFKCPDIVGSQYGSLSGTNNNKFTLSETTGNGDLTSPFALLTADESIFAGANDMGLDSSNHHFLKDFSSWASTYTMTPTMYKSNSGYVSRINVTGTYGTKNNIGLRPVTSLKACVKYAGGDGTSSNPYEVTIDDACSSAIN